MTYTLTPAQARLLLSWTGGGGSTTDQRVGEALETRGLVSSEVHRHWTGGRMGGRQHRVIEYVNTALGEAVSQALWQQAGKLPDWRDDRAWRGHPGVRVSITFEGPAGEDEEPPARPRGNPGENTTGPGVKPQWILPHTDAVSQLRTRYLKDPLWSIVLTTSNAGDTLVVEAEDGVSASPARRMRFSPAAGLPWLRRHFDALVDYMERWWASDEVQRSEDLRALISGWTSRVIGRGPNGELRWEVLFPETYKMQGEKRGRPKEKRSRSNPSDEPLARVLRLDGARYFSDEALQHALDEAGPRSRTTVVSMSPDDFLRLAERGHDTDKAAGVESALKARSAFRDVPYLTFRNLGDDAVVTGHEGRHRAMALERRGVQLIPVRLVSQEYRAIPIRWSQWQNRPPEGEVWPARLWPEGTDEATITLDAFETRRGRSPWLPFPDSLLFPRR